MIRCHIIVTGIVQGVFFRRYIKENAEDLKLNGWAKNKDNDKVEILVEGDEADIEELIDICSRGPQGAEVEDVEVKKEKYIGNLKGFTIAHS
ncbi:acylphosphatase [Candidatus Woesearchaeota archaeon]|nr:acylphosphatase [Candidatus Woesearchaeota archaeon]MBW3013933.1 acylphosphatase [Candidatus Woesearchaeota archaeon]